MEYPYKKLLFVTLGRRFRSKATKRSFLEEPCSLTVRFPYANAGRGLAPAATGRGRNGWLFRKSDDSEQIYGSIVLRGRRGHDPALRYGPNVILFSN